MPMPSNRTCLYAIRLKSTKEFFSGKPDMWRYFLQAPKPGMFGYDENDPDYQGRRFFYVSANPHDAALYVSKSNAEDAIKDTTRRVKKYSGGYIALPVDECEIVSISFTVNE